MKISRRSFNRIYSTLYLVLIMIAIILISAILLLNQTFNSTIVNMSIVGILIYSAIIAMICCFDVVSKLDDIKEYQTLEEDEE